MKRMTENWTKQKTVGLTVEEHKELEELKEQIEVKIGMPIAYNALVMKLVREKLQALKNGLSEILTRCLHPEDFRNIRLNLYKVYPC